MTKIEYRSEEDFRQHGFRVMNADNTVSENARMNGIDKSLILMRGKQTFVSHRYKRSGLFADPSVVR